MIDKWEDRTVIKKTDNICVKEKGSIFLNNFGYIYSAENIYYYFDIEAFTMGMQWENLHSKKEISSYL